MRAKTCPTTASAVSSSIPAKGAAASGESVYKKNCAGCHGDKGEGKSGPKLAGKKLAASAVQKVVTDGKPPKMPAFGKKLSAAEIKAVADYVSKLK